MSEAVERERSFWNARGRAYESARNLIGRSIGAFSSYGELEATYDPAGKRLLGNFPQAFTHLALVDAAQDLVPQRALRRRRDRPDDERITSAADDRDPGDVP